MPSYVENGMRKSLPFVSILAACFAEPPREPVAPAASRDCAGATAVPAPIRWIASSSFIFRGTVERVHATTLPASDRDLARYVVAHVDAPIVRGRDLDELHVTSDEVTIELTGPELPVGATATFFAVTREYNGGELAVTELGRAPRGDADAIARVRAALDRDPSYRAIATAEIIVAGRVTAIREWPRSGPISEHDPRWRVATIAVDRTACGSAAAAIDVGFASSADVAWYDKVKLRVGQRGAFLVHAGGTYAPPLVVVDALDVRAPGELAAIEATLR